MFKYLKETEFVDLHALFSLNVRSNYISDIVLEPMTGLDELSLGDNKLLEIPYWCDVEFNSYFPNLRS
jgi:Leucine-rich repeat (LRR) protein